MTESRIRNQSIQNKADDADNKNNINANNANNANNEDNQDNQDDIINAENSVFGRLWNNIMFCRIATVVCMILAACLIFLPALTDTEKDFTLTMLDVGQGDSFLIQADDKTVLIDGGGQPTDATAMAENVILPYIRTLGIKDIDMVFNTHPDNDHIGGLFAVIDEMPVEKLCVYNGYTDSIRQQQLLKLADTRNVDVEAVSAGQIFDLSDNFSITVLSPEAGGKYSEDVYNEGSLVLHIQYQELDIILTGDTNGNELLNTVNELSAHDVTPDDIEILQLPHHGSPKNYNSEWCDEFSPQSVLISVGRNNRYGHPGNNVIEYWQERNVDIYRTDLNGACRVIYDGGKLSYQTVL